MALDARRWRFHPLGIDQPLYTNPRTVAEFAQRSTPLDVPEPISRRVLDAYLTDYYAAPLEAAKSLRLYAGTAGAFDAVPPSDIRVCNLEDQGATWAHLPTDDRYVIDPLLGRVALPASAPAGTGIRVDFHYGFSGELGGGEYDRSASLAAIEGTEVRVPDDFARIQDALDALGADGAWS